ncbi:electron transfer flavoprotein subunit beta/FixA family protein [Picrophilus oshimae]|nr:electron transfer flavoprotein subunit beta/FixA family protein [Picrophilus oshimae]
MEIIVLVKQMIDLDQIKIDSSGRPITENIPYKTEILSKNAIEAAVQLKEKYGGHVVSITFGNEKAGQVVKEALAMGVDESYIITGYDHSDPLATGKVLASKIKSMNYDVIILGNQSADSYTGLLPGILSGLLNINIISNAISIEIDNNKVRVTSAQGVNYLEETNMPVIISVAQEINTPRLPTIMQIMAASKKKINIEESKPEYNDVKILSNLAPKSERKKIIYKDDNGIDEIAKVLKGVSR